MIEYACKGYFIDLGTSLRLIQLYQSKVVDESIANGGSKALIECGTEQSSIIIVRSQEWFMKEGKGYHSIDVENNHTKDSYPQ